METVILLPIFHIFYELLAIFNSIKISSFNELKPSLLISIILQPLIISLPFLDGGVFSSYCLSASIVHWLVVIYLRLRRKNNLTKIDQILIRLGFYIFLIIGMFVYPLFYELLISF